VPLFFFAIILNKLISHSQDTFTLNGSLFHFDKKLTDMTLPIADCRLLIWSFVFLLLPRAHALTPASQVKTEFTFYFLLFTFFSFILCFGSSCPRWISRAA
jgi:hypothetical protein